MISLKDSGLKSFNSAQTHIKSFHADEVRVLERLMSKKPNLDKPKQKNIFNFFGNFLSPGASGEIQTRKVLLKGKAQYG